MFGYTVEQTNEEEESAQADAGFTVSIDRKMASTASLTAFKVAPRLY